MPPPALDVAPWAVVLFPTDDGRALTGWALTAPLAVAVAAVHHERAPKVAARLEATRAAAP
ncbi:hypothetical protein [Blastococcus deserti]|uniref:Uncharacterized protein n=1 Tax=Blastococcus deserti TaxID=2259033 RepID=A0ABW4X866_9ACTN